SERDRRRPGRQGQARRSDRENRRHRPRRRRPPPLQHDDPWRARGSHGVVGPALDWRPRDGATGRAPEGGAARRANSAARRAIGAAGRATGAAAVSQRRDTALATLRRLDLAVAAVSGDGPPDDRLGLLLEGTDGVALADALGELGGEATARLVAEKAASCTDRALRKALRRAVFRLGQRGITVPSIEAPRETVAAAG